MGGLDREHPFVGRGGELASLERILRRTGQTGVGAMVAMRGRRRVGKSRLVEELIARSGCHSISYTPVQGPSGQELERFLTAVSRSDAPAAEEVRRGAAARSWEAALTLAVQGATRRAPLILVIDELPYLAAKEPTIEAVLQLVWDRTFERMPVLVILVGSDRAMMEALTEVGRPLYDRAREMIVRPLDPATIADLLALPAADALDAYAVIGGFPVLALEWGRGRSLFDYLAEALSDPTSFLLVSAERALSAELPADVQARAVLEAIGGDARAHRAIGDRTGLPHTSLARTLTALAQKGMVEARTPYSTARASKGRLYLVTDPYLRFYLRFLAQAADTIERGRGELVLAEVRTGWPAFLGRSIEPIVAAAVERMLPDERLGAARRVGSFWNRTHTVEVDLVGGDTRAPAREIGFVGEVEWRRQGAFTRADAAALIAQRPSVPGADVHTALLGVSRQGFEPRAGLDLALGPEQLIAAYRTPGAVRA
ncbi:MAG: ATP-binding protein [Solirubrobacteraceae bacterium]